METLTPNAAPSVTPPGAGAKEIPFGVNEVRLNLRQWVIALCIVGGFLLVTPRIWEKIERFDTGPDYRIPYQVSKDYWLYGRRLRQVSEPDKVIVLGDSVIWGEYVLPDGTLPHFLNQCMGATNRFINAGLNGLFPLAQEGLIKYYSGSLRKRKVLLHCNVLWMTSPKADLSTPKEEQFNHSGLVPQFCPRIPCYRADANERLSVLVERNVDFISWVGHLQNAYFGQQSILNWTLANDGGSPPDYPNSWKNPLSQIRLTVPVGSSEDPQRGPASPRHKAWSTDGQGTTVFEWVELDRSLQWQAFQRVLEELRERGNDILVLLGPFNEHMLAQENRGAYQQLRQGIIQWLKENRVAAVVPEPLPGELYADASHPLTQGYELLSRNLCADSVFQSWLRASGK